MGKDKALLPMNGTTMSLALAEKYKSLGPVAFSVDRRGRFPVGDFLELEDRFPGCGPLNGIISAFSETEEDILFLTATDMPGGSIETVRELMRHLEDLDACILRGEPLFGVYRRSCLENALRCMEGGKYSMRGFLDGIDVAEIETEQEGTAINLNTPEELALYREHNIKTHWR